MVYRPVQVAHLLQPFPQLGEMVFFTSLHPLLSRSFFKVEEKMESQQGSVTSIQFRSGESGPGVSVLGAIPGLW